MGWETVAEGALKEPVKSMGPETGRWTDAAMAVDSPKVADQSWGSPAWAVRDGNRPAPRRPTGAVRGEASPN